MKTNILILGGGLQALSTAYSLWKEGIYAICLADEEEEIRQSRFIKRFYPQQKGKIYEQILAIIQSEQIGLIIPMSDYFSELLSKHNVELESEYNCHVPVPNHEIFIQGADKEKLMAFCEQNGFPHPRTRALNATNIEEVAQYVQFPALIKPNRSVGARGIKLVHSLDELKRNYPAIHKTYGDATLQEYVDSKDAPYYNVMLYRSKNGQIIGSTIIEILRFFPIKGGSSSLCRTIEAPELKDICEKVLHILNWEGMADFDVLKAPDGEYKIIEINPRVPASLRAADIAGVNFPMIMLEQEHYIPTSYKVNQYLRYFGLDIMWFLSSPNRFKAKPAWFFSIGRNVYFQDIYAKDPSTWFSWLINGFKRFLRKRKHIQ